MDPTPQSHVEIMAALAAHGIDAELTPEPVAWMDGIPIFIHPIEDVRALRFVTWSDAPATDVPLERALVINNQRTSAGTLARSYAVELPEQPGVTRLMFDYVWVFGPAAFDADALVYALRLFHAALVADFGLAAATPLEDMGAPE